MMSNLPATYKTATTDGCKYQNTKKHIIPALVRADLAPMVLGMFAIDGKME